IRLVQSDYEDPPRLNFSGFFLGSATTHLSSIGMYERELDDAGKAWKPSSAVSGGTTPSDAEPWLSYEVHGQVRQQGAGGGTAKELREDVDQLHAVVAIPNGRVYCYTSPSPSHPDGELCVAQIANDHPTLPPGGNNKTSFGDSTFIGMFPAVPG